ncbi:MAG: hypothetical protein ACO1OF_16500 [Adhaeribacter sp.]
MTLKDYEAYFERLATQFKPIGHSPQNRKFVRISIEELFVQMRSGLILTGPGLVLEVFEGELQYTKSDNNPDNQAGAFYILQNVRQDDFKHETEVLDRCLTLGKELAAKIFRDSRYGKGPLQNFDLDKIRYHKVGPFWDNAFGYRFEFSWWDAFKPVVNPDNWSE